jgi:hypothetical protein
MDDGKNIHSLEPTPSDIVVLRHSYPPFLVIVIYRPPSNNNDYIDAMFLLKTKPSCPIKGFLR